MQAICFRCGEEKKFALKMCSHCQALPQDRNDRIVSLSLSIQCLKEKNLIRASKYIKIKKRIPRFHENVTKRATELVEEETFDPSSSMSIELSESFFDFKSAQKPKENQIVTVHAIGKPAGVNSGHVGPVSRAKTYRVLNWEIGKDISEEEAKVHMDAFGCIYVWYRWMDNAWNWRCVTKSDFESLRKVER